jgi:hypothetical protein
MKITIVKPVRSSYRISNYNVETNVTKHDWCFKKTDTMEIDFDEFEKWHLSRNLSRKSANFVHHEDIKFLLKQFIEFKMEEK